MNTVKTFENDVLAKVRVAVRLLQEKGASVTLRAVRNQLGGGSYSTLAPLLRQIQAEPAAEAAAEDLDPRVQALETLAPGTIAQVTAIARHRVENEIAALRSQIVERDEENIALIEENKAIEEREKCLEEELLSKKNECTHLLAMYERYDLVLGEMQVMQDQLNHNQMCFSHISRHRQQTDRRLASLQRDMTRCDISLQKLRFHQDQKIRKPQRIRSEPPAPIQVQVVLNETVANNQGKIVLMRRISRDLSTIRTTLARLPKDARS